MPRAILLAVSAVCALLPAVRPAFAVDAGSYFERAQAAEKRGDFEEALEAYEAVIRLKGEDASVRHNRALIYLGTGHPLKALAEAKRAVELKPKNGRYRITLGVVFMTQKEPELGHARAHLKRAVSIMKRKRDHPGMATAYFNLGIVAQRRRRLVRARGYYRLAYEHNPADKKVLEALSVLDPAFLER